MRENCEVRNHGELFVARDTCEITMHTPSGYSNTLCIPSGYSDTQHTPKGFASACYLKRDNVSRKVSNHCELFRACDTCDVTPRTPSGYSDTKCTPSGYTDM